MKHLPEDSIFTFALVAIAIPTVVIGVLTVSAASELSPVQKSMQYEIFDFKSFRFQTRTRHNVALPTVTDDASDHPAAIEESPIDSDPDSVVENAPTKRSIIFEDLTLPQRQTLRKQLRIGGCPQDVEPAYKELCESMLRKQEAPESISGLRNPAQQ